MNFNMSRFQAIRDKIEYAEHQRQNLMNALYDSKKESKEPKFIVHTVADILSSTIECYDYCAQDILQEKVINLTKNRNILDRHNKGSLRAYFPFYENELLNTKNPFSELRITEPLMHEYLVSLAKNIVSTNNIPKTLFKYSDIIRLKNLVNEKKHDRLIAIEANDNQEILIENPNMKIIIPIKEQKGWNKFQVSPGLNVSRVTEFRLEFIDEEVSKFCMFATGSTRIILEDIYATMNKLAIAP